MRRPALPIMVIFLAVLAAAVALGQVGNGPGGAQAVAVSSVGDIEIANDRDGLPVFAASGIGPGGSARGKVEIAATGSAPVRLTLSRHDLLDTPGLGGGLLSEALTLTVTDVTDPAAPLAVYAGPLAAMSARPAGRLEPGARRTYEFVATLPVGSGAGDQNTLQGASVSIAYRWTASEAEEAGQGGPGPEVRDGTVAGQPPASAPPPAPTAFPRRAFNLRVKRAAKALRGNRLVVWAGCDRSCAIVVRGRLRARAGSRHHGAPVRFGRPTGYRPGIQKLRIRVPSKLRRWLAGAPGKRRLRAKLVFAATDSLGARASVTRTLALRPPRRR